LAEIFPSYAPHKNEKKTEQFLHGKSGHPYKYNKTFVKLQLFANFFLDVQHNHPTLQRQCHALAVEFFYLYHNDAKTAWQKHFTLYAMQVSRE
jgi:hypothetical protein